MCMNGKEEKQFYSAEKINWRAYKEGWMLDATKDVRVIVKTDYYHNYENDAGPTFKHDADAASFVALQAHNQGLDAEERAFYAEVAEIAAGRAPVPAMPDAGCRETVEA